MSLPAGLKRAVEGALRESGDPSPISDVTPVFGGDINRAARIVTGKGRYLLKWKDGAPPGFFGAEAHGLQLLADAGEIRVPEVHAWSDPGADHPAFIVMEWIDEVRGASNSAVFAERFGRALAALHRHHADMHGLDRDNFIGSLPQPNAQTPSWIEFYRDMRIGAQMEIARRIGRLPPERERCLRRLMERLDVFLDDETMPPSLLHGDLWSGNYMIAPGDEPVIIDPAVYYGHREVEMAFTELFGGFPERFYRAYNEVYPLDPGYAGRRSLYQLYPLMVHMNLFGGGYASRVDAICRYYVGRAG